MASSTLVRPGRLVSEADQDTNGPVPQCLSLLSPAEYRAQQQSLHSTCRIRKAKNHDEHMPIPLTKHWSPADVFMIVLHLSCCDIRLPNVLPVLS